MTLYIISLTEHVSVTSLPFCKNESVGVAWERKSISSILAAIKTHIIVVALLEATSISGIVSRLVYYFRNITETNGIVEAILAGLGRLITLTESSDIADFIATSKGHITRIVFEEIPVIVERLAANTAGPSWRWRFNPWKKSSYDDEFTPPIEHKTITMPTLPESKQLEMVKMVFKKGFGLIFPFKDD